MALQVSIQGGEMSFHHLAAKAFFNEDIAILSRASFREVFEDIASGQASHGVVAIENTVNGSIHEVYDLLQESELHIIGEHYEDVDLKLCAVTDIALSEITQIYSHPVAINECKRFLREQCHSADIHIAEDTALSAKFVAETNDPHLAAIAGGAAAEKYGLTVLADDIENYHPNITRFIVISIEAQQQYTCNKSSILLTATNHDSDLQPGSLHEALGVLAKAGINLSKIESRPVQGKAWHYMFYLDLDVDAHSTAATAAFDGLQKLGFAVRVLGSYQKG